MKKIYLLISIFSFCCFFCSMANDKFQLLFDNEIGRTKDQRLKEAKEGNPYYFMILGYYINANDIMYTKTKDVKYLQNNVPIINAIISAGKINNVEKKGNIWRGTYKDKVKFSSVENKEVPLYEGYVFRYIAEFQYLLSLDHISLKNNHLTLNFIRDNFDKWIERSEKNYNDYSMLYRERVHMGAQWATVALYMSKLTGQKTYKDIYDGFNEQLKNNLSLRKSQGVSYYIWNSTYKNRFTKSLWRRLNFDIIQDVSHGNHIVQFVIDSYKLNYGSWRKEDLQLFANTVKYSIWQPDRSTFSDNVDGTSSSDKEFIGTGWKQADGWMKLTQYDKSLKDIYLKYYNLNPKNYSLQPIFLQFCANML